MYIQTENNSHNQLYIDTNSVRPENLFVQILIGEGNSGVLSVSEGVYVYMLLHTVTVTRYRKQHRQINMKFGDIPVVVLVFIASWLAAPLIYTLDKFAAMEDQRWVFAAGVITLPLFGLICTIFVRDTPGKKDPLFYGQYLPLELYFVLFDIVSNCVDILTGRFFLVRMYCIHASKKCIKINHRSVGSGRPKNKAAQSCHV